MFFVTRPRPAASTAHQIAFVKQNTARKVHLYNYFNKKGTYRPTTNQNGAIGRTGSAPFRPILFRPIPSPNHNP